MVPAWASTSTNPTAKEAPALPPRRNVRLSASRAADRATVRSLGAGAVAPPARTHNLPPPPTALLGRGRELAAARRRLIEDGARLLTLTGPGGILHEGRDWLEAALARSSGRRDHLRLNALQSAGFISAYLGEYEAGRSRLDEALPLARELGDASSVARVVGMQITAAYLNDRAEGWTRLAAELEAASKGRAAASSAPPTARRRSRSRAGSASSTRKSSPLASAGPVNYPPE
jgi:hypothetical protein